MTFEEFNQRWNKLGPGFPKEMVSALQRGARLVQRTAQEKYLTGPRPLRLGVVTGRLRRSITTRVQMVGTRVEALVGTNVVYARIHELGGQSTRWSASRSRTATRAWKTTMPARPFLSTAIRDRADEVKKMVREGTVNFIARTLRGTV